METNSGVMVFCAHPDDHIIGAGGTIAKYSSEGRKVIVVIASFGEKGAPWFKETVVRRTRKRETLLAAKFTNEHKDIILGLKEGNFTEELNTDSIRERIRKLIKTYRIKKIFTHSIDDPIPDHKAVLRFVLELTKDMDTVEVFSFNVWNPFIIRKTNAPKMYVDISDTFSKKAEALKTFRSQRHAIPLWFGAIPYWFGALLSGLRNKTRYSEVFVKVK